MAKFILKYDKKKLKEIPIDKETVTIGRMEDNDVVIDNLSVSRHHARLVQEKDKYLLEDMSSHNGTFINDEKIIKRELNEGDNILIGKHILTFLKEIEADRKKINPPSVDTTVLLDTKKHRELKKRGMGKRVKENKK